MLSFAEMLGLAFEETVAGAGAGDIMYFMNLLSKQRVFLLIGVRNWIVDASGDEFYV